MQYYHISNSCIVAYVLDNLALSTKLRHCVTIESERASFGGESKSEREREGGGEVAIAIDDHWRASYIVFCVCI